MSKANPAPNAMRAAGGPVTPLAAKRLAALAAEAIASAVLLRAVRQAHRELAAMNDRALADIDLDRALVEGLATLSRRRTGMSLA
jgi:uncharacterized protein YjiS (DUF1127 family)